MEYYESGNLVRIKVGSRTGKIGKIDYHSLGAYKVIVTTDNWGFYEHGDLEFLSVGRQMTIDENGKIAKSPIRITQKREIIPGTYGRVCVTGTYKMDRITLKFIGDDDIQQNVSIVGLSHNELREAAHLFNQLAEAIEHNLAETKSDV